MKAWIGDSCRFAWGLFYWNTRKSWYRLRKHRGTCPCQNPSDSGRSGETGCEAVMHWQNPARFKRVCPLLVQGKDRRWVCSVNARDVRPFWGRAWIYTGASAGLMAVLAFIFVFSLLRVIGYEVSPRQLIWPPAWSELRVVKAQLFIKQAQAYYAEGNLRDAIRALSVGYQYDPANYTAGRTLARFYEASSVSAADDLYGKLMAGHPAQRNETARVWFRSLLARGQFAAVIDLARQGIAEDKTQAFVWTNALIFSARALHRTELLSKASQDERYPDAVKKVLALAGRVEAWAPAGGVALILMESGGVASGYEWIYRIEQLIAHGFPDQALELLGRARGQLSGRDMARLLLAAYAVKGDAPRLVREFDGLLKPGRNVSSVEFSLLAQHLVAHPDPVLLKKLIADMGRIAHESTESKVEAYLTLYCAAGVAGQANEMKAVKNQIVESMGNVPSMIAVLEAFFMINNPHKRIELVLPVLTPMSLELIYSLLGRYVIVN